MVETSVSARVILSGFSTGPRHLASEKVTFPLAKAGFLMHGAALQIDTVCSIVQGMKRGWLFLVPLAFLAGFATCYAWITFIPEPLETDPDTTIGFIGCSNTAQSVIGYRMAGGDDMWKIPDGREHNFDGGAVVDWFDIGNSFWRTFDRYLGANPNTRVVWWQMCVRHQDEPTLEDALEIVSGIKDRIPGVTVYVSALPSYQEGVCGITGTEGLSRGKALARELIAAGGALPGPELRTHAQSEVLDDGCHLTEDGMRGVGEQIKQFFDAL